MAAEYIQGWLIEGGPNQDLPRPPSHPNQGLPSGGYIDNSLPPPPGIWPPPVEIWPPTPLPPNYPMPPGSIWPPVHPVYPSHGLPVYPNQGLPPVPGHPDQGLPPVPGHPDQGLPSPGQPSQGLPSQKFLVAIVAASAAGGLQVIGYTVVDPSLSVGFPLPVPPGGIVSNPIAPGGERPSQGLPPAPGRPGQGLPPTAEPKR
jgi:hypothetical protein